MSDLVTETGEIELPLDASPEPELTLGSASADSDMQLVGYWTALTKRGFDIFCSAILLLLLSPVFLVIGGTLLRSGRPILFAQERAGCGGRPFRCLKFRTMIPGAEEILERLLQQDPALQREWQQNQKLKVDFRITRLGALLRKWSLDELPQLWNVLCGDMSLVGPRPALLDQMHLYGSLARYYYAVRPGITGPWQVGARGDGGFERRIELDCQYVQQLGFWSDLWLLLRTFPAVLSARGAR
jgi:lipopolysaccharide/colanic/teichoic acid biosynthesis glycosyltransferase